MGRVRVFVAALLAAGIVLSGTVPVGASPAGRVEALEPADRTADDLKREAIALLEDLGWPDPDDAPHGRSYEVEEILVLLRSSLDQPPTALPDPIRTPALDLDVEAARRLRGLLLDPKLPDDVKADIGTVVATLVAADRRYVEEIVDGLTFFGADHLRSVQARVDAALRELAKGDAKRDDGKAVDALRFYAKAWEFGADAIEGLWAAQDPDGDLLLRNQELELGLDPDSADSDGDGLPDGEELLRTGTDPTLVQTADDGVDDGARDPDADGLTHLAEHQAGTDPLNADTDGDGLDDGHEVLVSGTDPLRADSDEDGLTDDSELRVGTDPWHPDTDGDGLLDGLETYTTTAASADGATAVVLTGMGDVARSASFADVDDPHITDLPGQLSDPVDITVGATFDQARVEIAFDPAAVPNGDVDGLRILYYDEEAGAFLPLDSHGVDAERGVVWADTTHFSVYVLFYIPTWQQVWTLPQDGGIRDGGGGVETPFIDVVLTLDSSGSMGWNDPSGLRRQAAKEFVDALLEGDRVAVVDFDSWARLLWPLSTDFARAKGAIDRIDSSGGTNIYRAVDLSLDHLDTAGDPEKAPLVILLTDGVGSYSHTLTQRAQDAGVVIFTIGLGTGVDDALLRSIADGTGGAYFPVGSAADLPDVFRRIGEGDGGAGTDSDGDGIPDQMELDGIRLGTGELITTDPNDPDTDGDGLTDGEELVRVPTSPWGGPYRKALSDPRRQDTDGDGLSDVDERDLGTNRWRRDSDGDGLSDGFELDNDFDPSHHDPDGDGRRDFEEWQNDSDPFYPERTGWDRGRAVVAGAVYGDIGYHHCSWFPLLSCETTETLEYLGGAIASGFIAVGDVRDALSAIADLNLGDTLLSLFAIIPIAGDAAKVADAIADFVKHSDRLAPLARWLVREFDNTTVQRRALDAAGAGEHALDLPHRVLESLGRSGNDMAKIETALKQGTRLVDDVLLSTSRRAAIRSRVAANWPRATSGAYRSHAYGVETAVEVLESRGYQILYVGRPGAIVLEGGRHKTLTAGPDIVAVRNGRTVVVEAKGSKNTISLSSRRMRSTVGPGSFENSRRWLETDRNRYLLDLERSSAPGHRHAASLLSEVAAGGSYDAVFIGAGGRGQRFGRIDDVAGTVSRDAGTVEFITTVNPDI